MKLLAAISCLAISTTSHRARRATWGYGELGADWEGDHCLGKHQSPIDIVTTEADLKPAASFKYTTGHYGMERKWISKSNGHTVVFEPTADESNPMPFIESAALIEGKYQLAQFHFHWGSSSGGGSEHTIDDKRYFSELHLVHYNTKYSNLTASLSHGDGLAVLGFFMDDSGTHESPTPLEKIVMGNGTYAGEPNSVKYDQVFSLRDILKDPEAEGIFDEFWRYKGSLTTPPCNEVVQWTVVKKPLKISAATRDVMLKMAFEKSGEVLVDNYREIQPLNDRRVSYYSNDVDKTEMHEDEDGGHDGHDHAEPEPEGEGEPEGEEPEEEPSGGIFAEGDATINQFNLALISLFIALFF